jgi:hypothetical protein
MQDVHCVDLLESTTLMFAEEEVSDKGPGKIACSKHVAIHIVDVIGDEAGEECDEEVPDLLCC